MTARALRIDKHTRTRQLLAHILEQPGIVATLDALAPETVAQLIAHVGLEDAGELVLLLRPEQLAAVLDEDLWHVDEEADDGEVRFDDARFLLWLEVLLESDPHGALRHVLAMDEDLLTLALCRQLFVIDVESMAQRMAAHRDEDDEPLIKEIEGALSQEFEQYAVLARNHRSWEPLCTLLVELDAARPDFFARLIERCCHITNEHIDDNGGLYEVLTSAEMVEVDAAAAREERRGRHGYVAESAARAFLKHVRSEPWPTLRDGRSPDPTTHAYFRDALPRAVSAPPMRTSGTNLLETLRAAEIVPPTASLPQLGDGKAASSELLFVTALARLRSRGDAGEPPHLDQLAYLANVLLAGCPERDDVLRPADAAQAVLAVCNLGAEVMLHHAGQRPSAARMTDLLRRETAVKLFQVGWRASCDALARSDTALARQPIATRAALAAAAAELRASDAPSSADVARARRRPARSSPASAAPASRSSARTARSCSDRSR